MAPNILVTGCSSGGKSTLIDALAAQGFSTVPEPGRRIVAQERIGSGSALPWVNPIKFAERALAMARDDLARHYGTSGPVFFDRGLIDAAVALQTTTDAPLRQTLGPDLPYDRRVFLAPPWPEIYITEPDRPHGMDTAIQEYDRITAALADLGYAPAILPRAPVPARVQFVLEHLKNPPVIP